MPIMPTLRYIFKDSISDYLEAIFFPNIPSHFDIPGIPKVLEFHYNLFISKCRFY